MILTITETSAPEAAKSCLRHARKLALAGASHVVVAYWLEAARAIIRGMAAEEIRRYLKR